MIKIRLARRGSTHKPKYSIVVCNDKSPRDGKFIHKLGYYNPISKEFKIDEDKLNYYLSLGAQMTTRVRHLCRKVA